MAIAGSRLMLLMDVMLIMLPYPDVSMCGAASLQSCHGATTLSA